MSDEQADVETDIPPMDEAQIDLEQVVEDVSNGVGILDEKSADVAAVEAAVEAAAGVSSTFHPLLTCTLWPNECSDNFTHPLRYISSDSLQEAALLSSEAVAAAAAAAVAAVTADVDATVAALNVNTVDVKGDDDFEHDDLDSIPRRNARKRGRDYKKEDFDDDLDDDDLDDDSPLKKGQTHESQLASRRQKDRQRYANMTPEQRQIYNAKRREQYHRQTDNSRVKRRERERSRYHSLNNDAAKDRNARRARLERERYQKLSGDELEHKNRRRRERAASARTKKEISAAATVAAVAAGEAMPMMDDDPKESVEEAVHQAMEEEVPLPDVDVMHDGVEDMVQQIKDDIISV